MESVESATAASVSFSGCFGPQATDSGEDSGLKVLGFPFWWVIAAVVFVLILIGIVVGFIVWKVKGKKKDTKLLELRTLYDDHW